MANELKEALPDVFPLLAVEAALNGWWDDETADAALPGDEPGSSDIMKPAVEIDSHRAVRALVTLGDIVKFDVPESAIKEGGYDSFEEMKEHLIPRVAALFEKQKKKENV